MANSRKMSGAADFRFAHFLPDAASSLKECNLRSADIRLD